MTRWRKRFRESAARPKKILWRTKSVTVTGQYLLMKKGAKVAAGKPAGVADDDWNSILDETTARRFDTDTRPTGTFIPVREDPKNNAFVNFLINL